MRDVLKKVIASIILTIPPVVMLLSEWFGKWLKPPSILRGLDDGYYPYFGAVMIVFAISLILVYISP
ncbi:MAG: hypothetical protein PWQ79_2032 [Thermococcaceae archaeon]|nr:hypothetical protein [Thermococcaceae archaeon]MDK2915117.1 hypothetical protein [Thermococcaceae archaeon]